MANIIEARRSIFLNEPHTATASGDIATFSTDMIAPLKECVITINPQQSGSGDASPDNIRPLIGWTGTKVLQSKTNLFYQDTLLQAKDWVKSPETIPSFSGVPTYGGTLANLCGASKPFNIELPIDFKYEEATQYKTSWWWRRYTPSTAGGLRTVFHYSDGTTTNTANNSNNTENFVRRATLSSSGKTVTKIRLNYNSSSVVYLAGFSIEKVDGNDSTETDVLPSAERQIVDWADSAGTIYGGTINLLTGVMKVNYILYNMGDLNWGKNGVRFESGYLNDKIIHSKGVQSAYCEVYNAVPNMNGVAFNSDANNCDICFNASAGRPYLVLKDDRFDNATDLKTALADKYVLCKTPLTNPYATYYIDPITLKTLKGINNIWSSVGEISLKYWKH